MAILNSNNIWIVGNIPEEDFEGGNRFNLLRISHSDTTKERIPDNWPNPNNSSILSINQINILDDEQIGFLMGAVFVYWNGHRFITDDRLRRKVEYNINLFEGPALDKLFFLGNNGTLFKKDAAGYMEIETDLTSDNSVAYFANDTLKIGTEHALRQYMDWQVIPEFPPDAPGRYYDIWHSGTTWWYATSRGQYRFSPDSGYVQIGNQSVSFMT